MFRTQSGKRTEHFHSAADLAEPLKRSVSFYLSCLIYFSFAIQSFKSKIKFLGHVTNDFWNSKNHSVSLGLPMNYQIGAGRYNQQCNNG